MKFEHIAFNVESPVAVAEWYVRHLNMTVCKALDEAPYTHFLADESESAMIEIYHNPPDSVPDYANEHPLRLHIAFVSHEPNADKERLLDAGCSLVEDQELKDGSRLIMLRDPWGFPLQLCRRAKALLP